MAENSDVICSGYVYNKAVHDSIASGEFKIKPLLGTDIPKRYGPILEQYSDNTFKVGDTKAFQIISEDFQDRVQTADKRVAQYLEMAEEARSEIEECILIDMFAKQEADKAYAEVMAKDKKNFMVPSGDYEKDENGILHAVMVYSQAKQEAEAKASREKVWRRENCYLWND